MMNNERITCTCDQCATTLTHDIYAVEFSDDLLCESCAEEFTFVCEECGDRRYNEDGEWVEDEMICDNCFDDETFECDCCHERFFNRHDRGDDNICLCAACRDHWYYRCENCGCLVYSDDVDWDDDYAYCESCYDEIRESRVIHDYMYKPEPMFHGDSHGTYRYFGVELEIAGAGEDNDNAMTLGSILNGGYNDETYAYIKHDGSLLSGMEIVSQPCTLDFHIHNMEWENFMKRAVRMGYRSHQTDCCGLHVHVSRDALGDDIPEQERAIGKILYFVERYWNELFCFSRRTRSNIEEWARPWGAEDSPAKLMDKVKSGYVGRKRYHNINLENDYTIEFRFFRGTLRYKTFIATLQLVNKIVDVAINLSCEEIQNLSWFDFVASIDEPELIEYLKDRNLYANNIINESEEF